MPIVVKTTVAIDRWISPFLYDMMNSNSVQRLDELTDATVEAVQRLFWRLG